MGISWKLLNSLKVSRNTKIIHFLHWNCGLFYKWKEWNMCILFINFWYQNFSVKRNFFYMNVRENKRFCWNFSILCKYVEKNIYWSYYIQARCLKTFDFGSDFLLRGFVSADYPWTHPEPLKNLIEWLVILHEMNIFWCWLL